MLNKLLLVVSIAAVLSAFWHSNPNRLPDYSTFTAKKVPLGGPSLKLPSPISLKIADKVFDGEPYLPEATIRSPSGELYVSSGNGSILRIDVVQKKYHHVVHTGGRPLGMRMMKDGRLAVADAVFGLLAVDLQTKSVEILCNMAAGTPVRFANSVEVTLDGTIYFTDSTNIAPKQLTTGFYDTHASAVLDILTGNPTGRLIKVNPATREATVVKDGLSFANGLALSQDESFLIFSDLGHFRILRLWLSGPAAGSTDVVLSNTFGYVDNIQKASDGGFWAAIASRRSPIIDALANYPFLREILVKIPEQLFPVPPLEAHVLKLSKNFEIEYYLHDNTGHIPSVTDASEYDGKLYLAAVNANYYAVLDLTKLKN